LRTCSSISSRGRKKGEKGGHTLEECPHFFLASGCPTYEENHMEGIKSFPKVPGTFGKLFEKGVK
jgi:hypothetical protein